MPPKLTLAEGPGRCPRCKDRVYQAEEIIGAGAKWHKKCFACKDCRKKLDSTTCNTHDAEIYCKGCYGRQFGPKGYGYGAGAGALTLTGK